jgi:hypothetical protein
MKYSLYISENQSYRQKNFYLESFLKIIRAFTMKIYSQISVMRAFKFKCKVRCLQVLKSDERKRWMQEEPWVQLFIPAVWFFLHHRIKEIKQNFVDYAMQNIWDVFISMWLLKFCQNHALLRKLVKIEILANP